MLFDKKRKRRKLTQEVIYKEPPDLEKMPLTSRHIQEVLGRCSDFRMRKVFINSEKRIPVMLIYLEGLVDEQSISNFILKPLADGEKLREIESEKEAIHHIEQGAVYYNAQKTALQINDVISAIIDGSTALVFDKQKTAIMFDTRQFEKRSITEPTGENIVKGAKDAFVETLRVNTATIRRKVKTPNLVFEEHIIGKQTHTAVCITYIDGIVNKNIVEEVRKRIQSIDTSSGINIGTVEEALVDKHFRVFPQVYATERTDKLCADIIEGRVGVLMDGIPVTLIVPVTIVNFLQAPEDYSQNFIVGSIIRMLRYALMIVTLMLPAFYISVTSFHPEMLPSKLVESVAASKEGVPFSIYIEVIIMLIAFEVLIEAGLRLPKTIGQAVSIVGALVVGEAAVTAKFISPGVVMVIATTAIASFTMPNQDLSNALRLWRFVFAILSSTIGLFGLAIGNILLLYSLASMECFGIPYLAPYAGSKSNDFYDTFLRFPMKLHLYRPSDVKANNKKEEKSR